MCLTLSLTIDAAEKIEFYAVFIMQNHDIDFGPLVNWLWPQSLSKTWHCDCCHLDFFVQVPILRNYDIETNIFREFMAYQWSFDFALYRSRGPHCHGAGWQLHTMLTFFEEQRYNAQGQRIELSIRFFCSKSQRSVGYGRESLIERWCKE